ncbi:MAG: hypothetical protein BIP78_1196 [Candidatus Bipolaricaulis sibiricus]|uniref:DNA polymerase III delta prime subunit n=1 Tax=Bipolaricaulis sibiricus TaxID=2501609 RepID=A0A410FVG4_BIPS1|nr:MAG: hypothetical protein BIP78_1196 [Candidatus Bipolaricaulis sibiricus]
MIPHLYVGPGARAAALAEAAKALDAAPSGHPDARVEVAQTGDVGIDRVRELVLWARYGPVRALRKVAVLGPAERLTREAANALLKLLEELPSHLAVVLFAEALDQVLPTVRSRCALLWCSGAHDQIEAALRAVGYSDDEVASIASVLDDRVEEAAAFLAERRAPLREWHEACAEAQGRSVLELAAGFASRATDPLQRRAWGRALAASLRRAGTDEVLAAVERLAKTGKDPVYAFLAELARFLVTEAPAAWPDLAPATRLAWASKASLARGELDDNANPRLLAEVVALWPRST